MNFKYGGYHGKILWVNLTTRKSETIPLSEKMVEQFIGGRGFGAKMLWDGLKPGIDPLGPDNQIIITTGPFAGALFPSSARAILISKSPQTGIYLYTIAGGRVALALKKAGIDVLVIEGQADSPVYLKVGEGKVEFAKANHLWGMKTTPTIQYIKGENSERLNIICIGPGGERKVKYASVLTDDHRCFGRGGAGAIMGSKNLKAVAFYGDEKVKIRQPDMVKGLLKKIFKKVKEIPGVEKTFPKYGTGAHTGPLSQAGILPTRNWRECVFKEANLITTDTMRDELGLVVKDVTCFGCPVHCKKLSMVKEGPYAGYFVEGPEYETLYSLGSNCGIGKSDFVIAANQICNELGIDTISAGVSLGFAMECIERGILSQKDTDGLDLIFGNDQAAFVMLENIGFRRGLGDLLAEGTRIASQRIGQGTDFFAMHVKGMELGGYDPRGAKGQAIVFAAGNRGGCHHSIGLVALNEAYHGTGLQLEGKAALVLDNARRRMVQDSTMNCTSAFWLTFDVKLWAEILRGITGVPFSGEDLYPIADRINSLERLFNFREGIKPEDDTLPRRLMEEPVPEGPTKGERVREEDLRRLLTEYYTLLRWSPDTGRPLLEGI